MVRSYLSKYQGTKPWTESEIYDAARACWVNSGGDVVLIRISDQSWSDQEYLRQLGEKIYGKI